MTESLTATLMINLIVCIGISRFFLFDIGTTNGLCVQLDSGFTDESDDGGGGGNAFHTEFAG
jgi:hypothetical protein